MKLLHAINQTAAICCVMAALSSCGNATLINNGKAEYAIVISEEALPAEKTAAIELNEYFNRMTGCKLPVITDAQKPSGNKEIVLGKTNREKGNEIDRSNMGYDGFMLKWIGNRLFITGDGKDFGRGTLYGAYELLRQAGCEFYSKDTERVPVSAGISLKKTDSSQSSPFEYRDLYWSCVFDEQISVKLRINGCMDTNRRNISHEYGGLVTYAGNHFVHTYYDMVPPGKYFDAHPEYYSEINGERTAKHLYSQLCLTNPDVLAIVVEQVKEWLREDPDSKIISVSQNDSFVIESYCTCEECRKVNEEEGSAAGTVIRFTNAVADAIKDEFPDVAIDMLAYQYSTPTPSKTVPRDNVIVRYCTGGCSSHAIDACQNNNGAKTNIAEWNKICDRLYIWDYTTNFAQYLCPFPNFGTLKPNIQYFRDHGVKGVFEQGMYNGKESGEFGDLRAYVLARLLWDPELDVEMLIDDFMSAFYGKGAPYIKEYFDYIHKVVADDGRHFNLVINCVDLFKNLISDEDMARLDKLWSDAKDACKDDKKSLEHVSRSELSYRFYKMCLGYGEFSGADSSALKQAVNGFYQDCNRLGVDKINEGAGIPWVEP